jgi:anti-sigma factor RsiW
VIDLTGSCRRHRAALTDFVDRGELGDHAEAAFAHLDRCDRCVEELEATALMITALRRLGDAMAHQEPGADAWPRLRTRLESRRTERFAGRSVRAAHLMGAALMGCLVASIAIAGPDAIIAPSSAPATIPEAARFASPAENPSRRHPPPIADAPQEIQLDARWIGPDGLAITLSSAPGAGARPGGPI